ncbi:toll/interleukin-1 receptor domain-containing protein [Streptomyces sp. V4I2]|uniref:toll/interleukin-1 receptor domain-containing protein n=1 Tax=Streptomyces sp. V4I2 TaxID=3042280 RepID=UPI002787AA30|nr:toll/interleukin-1 receptor domain-containing protein [Streptomyces sp. V4I2]MDQ1050302.1 hypothetical protein [Streptomyces sp. V4I2]
MDYEFDVFISYRRSAGHVREWVWNHFFPILKGCLEDEIGKVEIFIDRHLNDKIGVPWPDELVGSLRRSRLLVPVLSAPYFHSEWCAAEWGTMEERERLTQRQGLIFPVVFADGENFPAEVHRRQLDNAFKNYSVPHLKYRDSESYADFHQEVQRLAGNIRQRLEQVPEWCDDWPTKMPPVAEARPAPLPRFGA